MRTRRRQHPPSAPAPAPAPSPPPPPLHERDPRRRRRQQQRRRSSRVEDPVHVSMVAPSPTPSLPAPYATDVIAAALSSGLLLLSLASVASILHFHLRTSFRPGPRRRLLRIRDFNSLWAVRILLAAFASLWSLAELLRLPSVRCSLFTCHAAGSSPASSIHFDPCSAYVLSTQGFAEPCFFATLLFLLRASVQGKPSYPNAFVAALGLSLLSCLPFLLSHLLFLAFSPWVLSRLGIPTEVFFGRGAAGTGFDDGLNCSYPLFSTALLGGFGAVYVPWFASACWRAVAVVINKRLRVRLYALATAVVVGIVVQVAALALSAFWSPGEPAFEGLALAAFLGVLLSAAVGEGVLVLCPIADALDAVGWKVLTGAASSTAAGVRREDDGGGPGHVVV